MSGICGIIHEGAPASGPNLEAMLEVLALSGEREPVRDLAHSIAFGVARRWDFQQLAAFQGVYVCVDADLIDGPGLIEAKSRGEAKASSTWLAEFVAALYLRHGEEFVEKIRGAFAIAVWDESAQRLVLATDRIGIKPLYWAERSGKFAFGTRSNAVRVGLDEPGEVDTSALMQYLIFSAVSAPLSIYKGIQRLEPGHTLVFENGQIRQRQYWDIEYPEEKNHDVQDWSERVRSGMRAAVNAHIQDRETRRLGAYLSGGTDSSSVVAFMSESMKPVDAFSIAFTEDSFNEIRFARTTAAAFQARHHELFLKAEDVRNAIPKVIGYFDEPFANSSAIGAYFCAKMARDSSVDTLLAGDGGDELFAGNERYATDKRFQAYHAIPSWLRKGLIEPLARLLPQESGPLSLPARYIRRANIPNPTRTFSYNLFLTEDPHGVFQPDFLEQTPPDRWMEIPNHHYDDANASSELNRMLHLDVKMILSDNDLRKVSGTAELAGVNVRYPLLDDRLAEMSGRIPTSLKLRGTKKRFIFKEAMKGILPDTVLHKKKHGFGVPLAYWILQDKQLSEMTLDLLNDTTTRQRGYFRPEFYGYLLQKQRSDHVGYYGEVIWYLLVLELWHRLQSKKTPEATVVA